MGFQNHRLSTFSPRSRNQTLTLRCCTRRNVNGSVSKENDRTQTTGKNDRIKTRNTLVAATVADASRLQKIC
ncbi:hypothetical protein P8452_62885 [Trifolium repens]|nr:hypothetical protein P8452_62885 [Trifolium repens]